MSDLETTYQRQRRSDRWLPARVALATARVEQRGRGFWNAETGPTEQVVASEWHHDGYDYRAVVVYDTAPDTSWLGTFTDDPTGAIPTGGGYREYAYFRPENPGIDNLPHFQRAGMPADEARARCAELDRSEMRLALSDEWYGVIVTCSVMGRELGEASLWGIHDDTVGMVYCAETAREMADEATYEADATVAKHLGTVRELVA